MSEKANRPPNQYDTCPKHKGFYKSCGCNWRKGKSESKSEEEDNKEKTN